MQLKYSKYRFSFTDNACADWGNTSNANEATQIKTTLIYNVCPDNTRNPAKDKSEYSKITYYLIASHLKIASLDDRIKPKC